MLFGGSQTRAEIMDLLANDADALDNVIAMANVGAAFSAVYIFEDLVAALVTTSKVILEKKLSKEAIEASALFLEKNKIARASTLGRLVDAIEKSGVEGRDVRYLRAIVGLRNDFVHRLGYQVPLPGDWARYGYTLEQFSEYTRYVIRHLHFAMSRFSRIMVKHGLLVGHFGEFGGLLWNPDDPIVGVPKT